MEQARPRRATRRLGPRERARLQWSAVIVVCLLLYFIVFRPWVAGLIENRDFQTCQVNVKKIATALKLYMGDWDDTFPPGPTWMTAALGNLGATSGTGFRAERYFHCPADKSGAPSSYLYNDLLAGVPLNVESRDPALEARRRRVTNPSRFPMVIEKHGSPAQAHATIEDGDDLADMMTLPHRVPYPVGMLITGGGEALRRTEEQIQTLRGKRF